MDGISGMLNFDIKGNPSQRPMVAERLRLFTYATCLGNEESLVMVYDNYQSREFFRVSVGLENPEDLIADFERGLDIVHDEEDSLVSGRK